MEEKKVNWGTVGIIIALLILAASIFFVGIKINSAMQDLKKEIRGEIETVKKEILKEALSLIYAYRNCSMENRQITPEDVKKGRNFSQEVLE